MRTAPSTRNTLQAVRMVAMAGRLGASASTPGSVGQPAR